MLKGLFLLALGFATQAFASEIGSPQEGVSWLKKMAAASRQLNYSGTFVYRYSSQQSETSRIVHYVNQAGGEFERMETLDGPAREVIRTNDQIICYLPDARTVIIEKRGKRRFPALVPEQLTGVTENYHIKVAKVDRVAGHDCQVINLVPRDKVRYGHHFCAEMGSGLLLRARTYNEKREPLESFVFTEVRLGGSFNRDHVRSRYASKSRDWRVDHSAFSIAETPADTGWVVKQQPAGFRKLTELKRSFAGRAAKVSHIVYSDGLAAVSVFIEPMPRGRPAQNLWHQGAVNIYTRAVSEYMVTVLGEAPAATVMQIANSLEFQGVPGR